MVTIRLPRRLDEKSREEQIKTLEATFRKLGWHEGKEIRKVLPIVKLEQDEFPFFVKRMVFNRSSIVKEGWLVGTITGIHVLCSEKQQLLASQVNRVIWDGKSVKVTLNQFAELVGNSLSLDMKTLAGRKAEAAGAAIVQLLQLINPSVDVVKQDRCAICGKKLGWLSPHDEIDGRHFCSRQCIAKYQDSKTWEEQQRKREEARVKEQALREEKRRKREEQKQALKEREQDLRERITSEPTNPVAYFELGQFLSEQRKNVHEARDFYTKALALGLSNPIQKGIAHHDLGCDCYSDPWGTATQRWKPNIAPYEAFLSSYERKPTAQQIYDLEEAANEFNIALKSNPDDMETAQRLAHIYGVLGKKREQGKMLALAEEIKARKGLQAAPPLAKNDVQEKTGICFEEKCLKLLEKLEFTCRRTAITGDGGVDIVATSNQPLFSGIYIVQCKNWKNPVGEPPVRDLYGVVASENANKGILITSSTFTEAAQNFARGKNIELIDGTQLEQLILNYLAEDLIE